MQVDAPIELIRLAGQLVALQMSKARHEPYVAELGRVGGRDEQGMYLLEQAVDFGQPPIDVEFLTEAHQPQPRPTDLAERRHGAAARRVILR